MKEKSNKKTMGAGKKPNGGIEKVIIMGRNPNSFFKSYATNVIVDSTDVDVRINLFNEVIEGIEEKVAVCDGVIILHPQAASLLLEQLLEIMPEFEADGEIIAESRRRFVEKLRPQVK